jgi:hypothetical protein
MREKSIACYLVAIREHYDLEFSWSRDLHRQVVERNHPNLKRIVSLERGFHFAATKNVSLKVPELQLDGV